MVPRMAAPGGKSRSRRYRPAVEPLEARNLLSYTFTRIDSLDQATGFPSLNNNGTVAFDVLSGAAPPRGAIFPGKGGPATTIADNSGPFQGFGGRQTINDSGTVAFVAV